MCLKGPNCTLINYHLYNFILVNPVLKIWEDFVVDVVVKSVTDFDPLFEDPSQLFF